MPNRPVVFRTIVIELYYYDELDQNITHPVFDPTIDAILDLI